MNSDTKFRDRVTRIRRNCQQKTWPLIVHLSPTQEASEAIRSIASSNTLALRVRLDKFFDSLHDFTWLIDGVAHRDFQFIAA
jgi:hypothetical protein